VRHRAADLGQQGALADARLATDHDRRARGQAAAEHAIEFEQAAGDAAHRRGIAGIQPLGGERGCGRTARVRGRDQIGFAPRELDDGVHGATGLAAPGPARGGGAASGAAEGGLGLGHAREGRAAMLWGNTDPTSDWSEE